MGQRIRSDTVEVPAFAIDRYKVTNGQYLNFVEAGGYQESGLWAADAWDWKAREGIAHPLFWSRTRDGWRYRTMFEEIPLPLDWPVYVSHAEASAYAAWAGSRLPTEAEWHRAAYGAHEGAERSSRGVLNRRASAWVLWAGALGPIASERVSRGRGVHSVSKACWRTDGNGHPASLSLFPASEPFPFYEGYSANFFDGMHYAMKGGSPRTERSMLRRSFRNWFQPHYQYVYAGFRCVGK